METLELERYSPSNATTFELENGDKTDSQEIPLQQFMENVNCRRRTFSKFNQRFQTTFMIYAEGDLSVSLPEEEYDIVDLDLTVPLISKKNFKVKAHIRSIEKHSPKIFFD